MKTLKYKVITSRKQYDTYCSKLERLIFGSTKSKGIQDEIDLLTVLIEKWDMEHNSFSKLSPIQLIQSLMVDHKLKAVDLARILKLSEGQVSDILHYKKGLSKESIRILATHFKMQQEAFNRDYPLKVKQKSLITSYKIHQRKRPLIAAEPKIEYYKGKKQPTRLK